jgi:hypothetical protein
MKRILSAVLVATTLAAQAPTPAPNWDAWRFLLGDWVGEGSGQPGQGSGGFTFTLELEKRILVRRSRAEYPSYSHEDLMIVYPDADPKRTRAIYFDNEGHVIEYAVTFSPDGNTVTFLSAATPAAPRFRLTYTKSAAAALKIKFEIAPPGKPEAFSTYLEASARRR